MAPSGPRTPEFADHHARPDPKDDRDLLYTHTGSTPDVVPLEAYLALGLPILDQGEEAACTGFALATVAHFLLRKRTPDPDETPVSPRMLYEMARHSDGLSDKEAGSTARGALKGWKKHGVCSSELWPYIPHKDRVLKHHGIEPRRAEDAKKRPLGSYFRVDDDDLDSVRGAIAAVGIVYGTVHVHDGWRSIGPDGRVAWKRSGAHAIALVGYDRDGLWFQNSKGQSWGRSGFGYLLNDDWLSNAQDAWVASLV